MITIALVAAAVGCREDSEAPRATEPDLVLDITPAPALAFVQVSTGSDHTCGVTTDDRAYCWGNNELGQLGIGTSAGPEACEQFDVACSTRPVRVVHGLAFRQVSAGALQTCGVTTGNVAYCWGTNVSGELGNGTRTGPESCLRFGGESACSTRPVRVAGGLAFRSVSVGEFHTCGVTTGNVAYCWGVNEFGQLGNGSSTGPETCTRFRVEEQEEEFACSSRPVRVVRGLAFRQVSAGRRHTCGVTTDNRAYCWGAGFNGQLGNRDSTGPDTCRESPTCSTRPVRVVRGLAFRQLSAGDDHVCGVTTQNLAFCWGSNGDGELGHGTSTGPEECFGFFCSTWPVRVVGRLLFGRVDGGNRYGCGLDTSNAAYCWGANRLGALGNGTFTGPETCPMSSCSTRPVPVEGGLAFRQLSAGAVHTCAVSTSGVAYCWGSHEFGQLGSGGRAGPEDCAGSPCSTRPVAVAPPARR